MCPWRWNLNSWPGGSGTEGFKGNVEVKFVYERHNLWIPWDLAGWRRVGSCLPGPDYTGCLSVHLLFVLGWVKWLMESEERGGINYTRACCIVLRWGAGEECEIVVDTLGILGREATLVLLCCSCRIMWLLRVCLCIFPGSNGDLLIKLRDSHITMQCLLCFALMVFLGKALHIPVFWAMFCSSCFSPRSCDFLPIAGPWALPHIHPLGARSWLGMLPMFSDFCCPKITRKDLKVKSLMVSPVDTTLPGFFLGGWLCLHSWCLFAPDYVPFL